jgi:hypothetical protein
MNEELMKLITPYKVNPVPENGIQENVKNDALFRGLSVPGKSERSESMLAVLAAFFNSGFFQTNFLAAALPLLPFLCRPGL